MEITVRRRAVTVTATQAGKADLRQTSNDVSLFDRAAWRDAGLVWLGQHMLFVFVIYVGRTLLLTAHPSTTSWRELFIHWLGWDGANYAAIARNGYTGLWSAGFSPLLPILEHLVSSITGLDPAVSGVLIANVAALGAFGVLARACRARVGTGSGHGARSSTSLSSQQPSSSPCHIRSPCSSCSVSQSFWLCAGANGSWLASSPVSLS